MNRHQQNTLISLKQSLTASAIMILTAVFLSFINQSENTPMKKSFSTFPEQIGEWVSKEKKFEQEIYDVLGVDDSFLCDYRTSDGRQVQLYIGYYQSQRQGDLIHSPKHCMPGAGWNILQTSLEEVIIPNYTPGKIILAKLIIAKRHQRQVALYWFQSRGRFISSEYMQKIYLVFDSITRHRTDGSFVRLIAPIINDDEEKTTKKLKNFVKLLIPILQEYLPS